MLFISNAFLILAKDSGDRETNRKLLVPHSLTDFGPSEIDGTRLERLWAPIGRCRSQNYFEDEGREVDSVRIRYFPSFSIFPIPILLLFQVCIGITEVSGQ